MGQDRPGVPAPDLQLPGNVVERLSQAGQSNHTGFQDVVGDYLNYQLENPSHESNNLSPLDPANAMSGTFDGVKGRYPAEKARPRAASETLGANRPRPHQFNFKET